MLPQPSSSSTAFVGMETWINKGTVLLDQSIRK
jgi:hypothetical protein